MITLTIDGKEVSVPAGSTILEAAQELNLKIPTLCYLNLEKSIIRIRSLLVGFVWSKLKVAEILPLHVQHP